MMVMMVMVMVMVMMSCKMPHSEDDTSHSCTHAPMHSCTHALMHPCTHALMHPCTVLPGGTASPGTSRR
jgi:hypothetical protein